MNRLLILGVLGLVGCTPKPCVQVDPQKPEAHSIFYVSPEEKLEQKFPQPPLEKGTVGYACAHHEALPDNLAHLCTTIANNRRALLCSVSETDEDIAKNCNHSGDGNATAIGNNNSVTVNNGGTK